MLQHSQKFTDSKKFQEIPSNYDISIATSYHMSVLRFFDRFALWSGRNVPEELWCRGARKNRLFSLFLFDKSAGFRKKHIYIYINFVFIKTDFKSLAGHIGFETDTCALPVSGEIFASFLGNAFFWDFQFSRDSFRFSPNSLKQLEKLGVLQIRGGLRQPKTWHQVPRRVPDIGSRFHKASRSRFRFPKVPHKASTLSLLGPKLLG